MLLIYKFFKKCFSLYGRAQSVVSSCWLKCVWSAGVDDPPSPEDLVDYYRSPGSAQSYFLHKYDYYSSSTSTSSINSTQQIKNNWLKNSPDISKACFVPSPSSVIFTAIPVRGSLPCVHKSTNELSACSLNYT